jgi:hypothetical protein
MSIVYTADIFCDGDGCSQWTHGTTAGSAPTKAEARKYAVDARGWWLDHKGKDYCPRCAKNIKEKR